MAWRKSELQELRIEGQVVERYEWSREPGGELHFTPRVFPVIALAEEVDGSRSRITYVVREDDLGKTRTMYPSAEFTADEPQGTFVPTRGGRLVIAIDPADRNAADSRIAQWKDDVREKLEKVDEEIYNSPAYKAHKALFEQEPPS